MAPNHQHVPFAFYTTYELAELLDVKPDWLRKNRKTDKPIPYRYIGRRSFGYIERDVLAWVGRKDLVLRFYSSKKLAQMLSVSERWLRLNRTSDDAIPFRRFGRLVRYNETEIRRWLNRHRSQPK